MDRAAVLLNVSARLAIRENGASSGAAAVFLVIPIWCALKVVLRIPASLLMFVTNGPAVLEQPATARTASIRTVSVNPALRMLRSFDLVVT